MVLAFPFGSQEIEADETVELFPTYAREVADAQGNALWEVRAEGVIFENEHENRNSIHFHALELFRNTAHYFGYDGKDACISTRMHAILSLLSSHLPPT